MKRITVLLADDNKFVRSEYRKLLELENDLEVVGEANDGHRAVMMVKKLLPAVVLMDVSMTRLNGIQATRQIRQAAPDTLVLMLSAHSDDAYVVAAINSGAMGYVTKSTAANCVCLAIREITKGRTFFSSSVAKHFHQVTRKK